MSMHNYIIRFPDDNARERFRVELEQQPDIKTGKVIYGEFLPDVIVHDISDSTLELMKRIAHPKAKFYEDIQFDVPRFD